MTDKLIAALDKIRDKLECYRREHGGEYVGGVEYTDCKKLIDTIRTGIVELTKERDALRAGLDTLHGLKFSDRNYHALKSRAEAAEAKLAECQEDAARYRWLRDDSKWLGVNAGYNEIYMCDLDTVIDAELAQPKPEEGGLEAPTTREGGDLRVTTGDHDARAKKLRAYAKLAALAELQSRADPATWREEVARTGEAIAALAQPAAPGAVDDAMVDAALDEWFAGEDFYPQRHEYRDEMRNAIEAALADKSISIDEIVEEGNNYLRDILKLEAYDDNGVLIPLTTVPMRTRHE